MRAGPAVQLGLGAVWNCRSCHLLSSILTMGSVECGVQKALGSAAVGSRELKGQAQRGVGGFAANAFSPAQDGLAQEPPDQPATRRSCADAKALHITHVFTLAQGFLSSSPSYLAPPADPRFPPEISINDLSSLTNRPALGRGLLTGHVRILHLEI